MKRILISALLLIGFASLSFGRIVAEGETLSPLGKFTIATSDTPMMIAGKELPTYLITYENSGLTVKVAVDKEKRCKNYIVVSDQLSVMYTCNGDYFGVNLLSEKYAKAGFTTETEMLDRSDYFHQKVLSRGMTTEIDAAKLIAVYFPSLILG